MEQINKYYFELSIEFESDYDVKSLEKILGIKADELVYLKDAVGPVKTAKFFSRTKELNNIYTDEMFEAYIKQIKPQLEGLPQILSENKGHLDFCIVFTQLNDNPCIGFNKETINSLASLGAGVQVDYAY